MAMLMIPGDYFSFPRSTRDREEEVSSSTAMLGKQVDGG
jgi:hypothetical protein